MDSFPRPRRSCCTTVSLPQQQKWAVAVFGVLWAICYCGTIPVAAQSQYGGGAVLGDTTIEDASIEPRSHAAILSLLESRLVDDGGSTPALDSDLRIVGGSAAPNGKFPFYINTLQPILCGGTLIHTDIVLSAAHCAGGFLAGVSLGGLFLNGTDGQFLNVDSELLHPDYDTDTRVNDIMLIKLSDLVTNVSPVGLNFNSNIPAADDVLTVSGYGDTSDGGDVSQILLEVDVDAYTDDFCDNLYAIYEPDTMICAGTEAGGRDSCQGDSGGPLFTSANVQVGVVSTGSGCGEPNIPAIYTEVAAYEAWIRAGICTLSDAPPTSCSTAAPVTTSPSVSPVTSAPVATPVTAAPVAAPVTAAPASLPTTISPTFAPTVLQFDATSRPTRSPITQRPTLAPEPTTSNPTYLPTISAAPSVSPQPSVISSKKMSMRTSKSPKSSKSSSKSSKVSFGKFFASKDERKKNMMGMMMMKGKKTNRRGGNIYVRNHPWRKFDLGV